MEEKTAKNLGSARAPALAAGSLAARASVWLGRYLEYGSLSGDPTGWSGMVVIPDAQRRGHSEIDS